jgi:hypothetical protein
MYGNVHPMNKTTNEVKSRHEIRAHSEGKEKTNEHKGKTDRYDDVSMTI